MGQVALGIRSLLIKAAVFFVMCALLVWALGGKLFPAPEIVDGASVRFDGQAWFWRLYAGGDEPGGMHWVFMTTTDENSSAVNDQRWAEVAGPIIVGDALYFAGRPDHHAQLDWVMNRLTTDDEATHIKSWMYPDRLAVEHQLERLRNGLPLQDVSTIRAQRPTVLDPPDVSADEHAVPDRSELTERMRDVAPGG